MAASGRIVDVLKPSVEKTNYIRLARLLMSGGTTIVREVFDSIIPPSQLPTMLNEPAVVSKLRQMRNRKIITFPQWKALFPSSSTCGKSESFDITLLFKLLREFCGLPAPPKGWDDLPDDKDHSLSAELARIKYYRNELCHAKEDLGISDGDFNTYENRIKDALLRMVQTLPSLGPSKNWEKEIDKLLTGPITEDDERNIEELKYWYLQDMETKDMLDKIIMKQLEPMQPNKESQKKFGKPEPPRYGTILKTACVLIDVEGGSHDLSCLGVLLQIPPNAVTHPTDITCVTFSPDLNCPPTEENETLVSYCVRFYSSSVPRLQKPMIVRLKHSGPSKKEGYETIVKAWKEPWTENCWKQMKEMREDTSCGREYFKTRFIEVEISEWTALAVVTRLITDTFEVTDKGCVVRSSVCDDVTVEFPEGAVEKTYTGSMKLLLMPDHIDILDDIAAYPCPLLLIDGFEGVSFNIPVKIRLPHPHPAGYPTGNVRLLTMDTPHEWKDITDQVHCVENESFIEVQVSHFSGSWVWIYGVSLTVTVVSSLSRYLFQIPQEVYFAVFKKNEVCSSISLTMTCVPHQDQFESIDKMKNQGYTELKSSTGNKTMRPGDKAYTKVEGCYQKKLKGDFFLQFIKNGICKKELPLVRKTSKEETSVDSDTSTELIISLLEKKDGDDKDNLCTFCIEESKIVSIPIDTRRSPEVQEVWRSASPGPSDPSCKELVEYMANLDLNSIDAGTAAAKVSVKLQLDKCSMKDPPEDVVKRCRYFCVLMKKEGRTDIVKELRTKLPSGITGPLTDENLLVGDMIGKLENLTKSLCAFDIWKKLAEHLGIRRCHFEFHGKKDNPAESILEDVCRKRGLTVGYLYDVLCKCDANALADEFL